MKKYPLLIVILAPLFGFGQYAFYNQGAGVYVQKNALVYVGGDFTNDPGSGSTAVVQNEGILEVKGDFTNEGSALFQSIDNTSTNRAVKFIGAGKQHIIGDINTAGSQSIYNLIVSQAAASDTVEMQANALVEGSLVFGASNTTTTYNPTSAWTDNGPNGLLKTFANNSDPTQQYLLSLSNGDNDAIAGYPSLVLNGNPSTGFVLNQGTKGNPGSLSGYTGLQRNVANNNSSYVYPVGTVEKGFNALRLNITSLPSGAQNVVASFDDSTSNANGYEGDLSPYCHGCGNDPAGNNGFNYFFSANPCDANQEFWMILAESTKNHGYWNVASNGGGNQYQYWVEAFMNHFNDNGSPLGSWRILRDTGASLSGISQYYYNPTNDDWTSQILTIHQLTDLVTYSAYTGNCYTGVGVPGGKYTGNGHFASFRENNNNALPVTLTSLTATPVNNQYIQLDWTTSLEINNSGFEVQRSTDGTHFNDMGWVAGHGNSTTAENYSYNDMAVGPGVVYYYQLRQVDFNGNSKETNMVTATLTGAGYFAVSDFIPNPSKDASKIIITTGTPLTVNVRLFNMLGQAQTGSTSYSLSAGDNNIDFNLQSLAAGNYTAQISTGAGVYTRRLVIAGGE